MSTQDFLARSAFNDLEASIELALSQTEGFRDEAENFADLARRGIRLVGVVADLTSFPANPEDGDAVFVESETQIYFWDATSSTWKNSQIVGSAIWGNVQGTLADQTDLQTALDGKQTKDEIVFNGRDYLNVYREITVQDNETANLILSFDTNIGGRFWVGGQIELWVARSVSSGSGSRASAHEIIHFNSVVLNTNLGSNEIKRLSSVGNATLAGNLTIGDPITPSDDVLHIPFTCNDSSGLILHANLKIHYRFADSVTVSFEV